MAAMLVVPVTIMAVRAVVQKRTRLLTFLRLPRRQVATAVTREQHRLMNGLLRVVILNITFYLAAVAAAVPAAPKTAILVMMEVQPLVVITQRLAE